MTNAEIFERRLSACRIVLRPSVEIVRVDADGIDERITGPACWPDADEPCVGAAVGAAVGAGVFGERFLRLGVNDANWSEALADPDPHAVVRSEEKHKLRIKRPRVLK